MAKGQHNLEFEVLEGWEKLPSGWSFTEVVGVAVDSRERVIVFCRGEHPVIVFDKDGKFVNAWGEGNFVRPHGAYITRDDRLFLTDDQGHSVYEFTPEGALAGRIGDGTPSDTGYDPGRSPVNQAAGPFNNVCNVALGPGGELYAADGYGNARVHKFSATGELIKSWGEQGSAPGQFNLPHGIAVDSAGLVYVADRENTRVQIFSPNGEYLREWTWVNRPTDIFIDAQDTIYIAELGFIWGNKPPIPHLRLMEHPPHGHDPLARVSICNPDGEIISRIGAEDSILPGNFVAPHGLWCSPGGDLYVGEVVTAVGAVKHYAPLTPHCFQKFIRGA